MPQYSASTKQPNGFVINAVLDTGTNQIIYTVVTPEGISATATTVPGTWPPGTAIPTSELITKLRSAGYRGGVSINQSLVLVKNDVNFEALKAQLAAQAANTSVPENPQPPPPVIPKDYPPIGDFEGVDLAVSTQENALKEPPLLTDEEVDQYLFQTEVPQYDSAPKIDTSLDDAESAKFNRQQALANAPVKSPNPAATGSARGLSGRRKNTRAQATAQDSANYNLLKDWRIRLSLASGDKSNYLYKAPQIAGILAPLKETDGVIFPYTPTVTINYVAGYEPTELTHSNYKSYNYKSSGIDSIYITGEFTAQNTAEANYVLAVIHFFRSVTKMFYGQDSDPINGTPPPLCYLHGYGAFNFDNHPLVISNFTYTLPNDVDYIRATSTYTDPAGTNSSGSNIPDPSDARFARMNSSKISGGAKTPDTNFGNPKLSSNNTGGTVDATYVPTKLTIQVNAYPIVSRNDISRRFSLEKYATGQLLRGSKQNSGGIW